MTLPGVLETIHYWWADLVLFRIDDAPVTAGLAILGALVVVLALGISWAVGVLLRRRLFPQFRLGERTQEILLRLFRYGIVLAGLLAGLSIIRIPVGSLQRLWSEVPLFTIQNAKITLSTMVVAAAAVLASALISRWARRLLQQRFLSSIKSQVVNELNRAVYRRFRAHGVEIPFPQRDLHLRSDATKVPGPQGCPD